MYCDRPIAPPKLDDTVFTQNGFRIGDSSDQCGREKQISKEFARNRHLGEVILLMKKPVCSKETDLEKPNAL